MNIGKRTIVLILLLLFAIIASFGFYQILQKPVEGKESEIIEPSIPIYEHLKNYTLKELASKCGIMIGTCVSYSPLLNDKNYREIIAKEFSVITPENELKFESVHPFRNVYTFSRADAIVSFAEENGIKVRGHCLVWHAQLPEWILKGNYTREEWIEILRDHIYTVVRRYKGRIYAWDVVNEAFNDDGTLRDSVWLRNIGPEYIELAFKWAHEADPDALLFYNDYGAEAINIKSNAIYEFVKKLLEKGVPIHGIGLQMHVRVEGYPNPQSVAENIKRFRKLGLKVEITEMDVAIRLPVSEEETAKQAEIYKNILKVYLNSDSPQAFIMWGFVDKYSWISYTFPGYGSATIFDDGYNPKPAYYALIEAMLEKIGA